MSNKLLFVLSATLQVIPLQLLAYALAERQGFTPGEVRYITKVITSEEGIPNRKYPFSTRDRRATDLDEYQGGEIDRIS